MDKDDYETLLFENDFQKNIIEDCLNVVKQFLLDRQRILVGGMAIDFALKLKGDKLYNDNKLPDYDFWSPEFHKDAYDLANILAKKYDGVSAINAQHISTMRVRVNFVVVADITYCPLNLYEQTKTLSYNGIRFIHPHYQMIDQHKALSLSYENPPRETIIGKRWKNDIERFELLYRYYKIIDEEFNYNEKSYELKRSQEFEEKKEATDLFKTFGQSDFLNDNQISQTNQTNQNNQNNQNNNKKENTKIFEIELKEKDKDISIIKEKLNDLINIKDINEFNTYNFSYEEFDSICLGGYISLIFWLQKAKEFGYLNYINLGELQLNKNNIIIKIPKTENINIISDNYINTIEKLNLNNLSIKEKYYNGLLDKIPRFIEYNNINIKNCDGNANIRIFDNKGRMLSSYQPLLSKRLYISNLQDILVYFLTYGCFYNNLLYIKLYNIGLSILFWACDKYNGLFLTSTEELNQSAKEKYNIFLPSPFIYGNYNWSETYIFSREKLIDEINNNKKYNLKEKKPTETHLNLGQYTQKNKYEFDASKSILYQFDGLTCEKFEPHELPEL